MVVSLFSPALQCWERIIITLYRGSGNSLPLQLKEVERYHYRGIDFFIIFPALKRWAKERDDHYRGLKTIPINC